MLIQFTVENHRSIKNSAVISFAASKDKSFEEYLLHPDEKKTLLPVLAIYGANAAGKSNVLHAMMTMKEMVVGNAAKVSKGQKLPWEPFGGTKVPTSFEIVFIFQGVRYTYGFSFDAKKIYKEYLYHWPNGREALIFSRENGVYEFRENVNEQVTLSNRTPDNKLYLVSSTVIDILKNKGYLENYGKSVDVFEELQEHQPEAIQYAKERVERLTRDQVAVICRDSNPVTTVYELVEFLNSKRT